MAEVGVAIMKTAPRRLKVPHPIAKPTEVGGYAKLRIALRQQQERLPFVKPTEAAGAANRRGAPSRPEIARTTAKFMGEATWG